MVKRPEQYEIVLHVTPQAKHLSWADGHTLFLFCDGTGAAGYALLSYCLVILVHTSSSC